MLRLTKTMTSNKYDNVETENIIIIIIIIIIIKLLS